MGTLNNRASNRLADKTPISVANPIFEDVDDFALSNIKFNLEELLARSKIGLRMVMKYYF